MDFLRSYATLNLIMDKKVRSYICNKNASSIFFKVESLSFLNDSYNIALGCSKLATLRTLLLLILCRYLKNNPFISQISSVYRFFFSVYFILMYRNLYIHICGLKKTWFNEFFMSKLNSSIHSSRKAEAANEVL